MQEIETLNGLMVEREEQL